jgi:hypothetical protein
MASRFDLNKKATQKWLQVFEPLAMITALMRVDLPELLSLKNMKPDLALQRAINANDLDAIGRALAQGADPNKGELDHANSTTQSFLTYSSRVRQLFSSAELASPSALTQSLLAPTKAKSPDEFNQLLKMAVKSIKFKRNIDLTTCSNGKSIHKTWQDALKKNKTDVQKALILLKDHGLPRSPLQNKFPNPGEVTDPIVKKALKQSPYYPSRHIQAGLTEINLNGKVNFKGEEGSNPVYCRHLVTQRVSEQSKTIDGKFRLNDQNETLRSEKLISETFTSEDQIEILYENICRQSPEVHLLNVNQIGSLLVKQFRTMKQADESVRLLILNTPNHVMSLRLRIKPDNTHVLEFYDPNKIATHKRAAGEALSVIQQISPIELIGSAKLLNQYVPPTPGVKVELLVVPANAHNLSNTKILTPIANRSLASGSPIRPADITPVILYHLIAEGFTVDLQKIRPMLKKATAQQLQQLLPAKDDNGKPALYRAFLNGDHRTIKAYGALVIDALKAGKIPEQQFVDLLLARENSNAPPSVIFPLQTGNQKATSAYGNIIAQAIENNLLSPKSLAKLLDIRDEKGNIGETAFKEKQNKIVLAYEAMMTSSNARPLLQP